MISLLNLSDRVDSSCQTNLSMLLPLPHSLAHFLEKKAHGHRARGGRHMLLPHPLARFLGKKKRVGIGRAAGAGMCWGVRNERGHVRACAAYRSSLCSFRIGSVIRICSSIHFWRFQM